MLPRPPMHDPVDRLDRRHRESAFGGAMRGQEQLASPLTDPYGRPSPQVSTPGSKPQVHSLTADFTAGQDLDGVSDRVQMSDHKTDPVRQFGWQASDPGTTVVALVPGVLRIGLWWRWGFLDGDPSKGRFRTPPKVKVTRTRDGTSTSVTFEDPRPAPGIDPTQLPDLAALRGDEFDLTLLHDDGEDRGLAVGGVTWSLWQTDASDPPPAPTDPVYLLSSYQGGTGEDHPVIYRLDADLQLLSQTVTTPPPAPNDAPSYWGLALIGGRLWTMDQNHTSTNALAAIDPDSGVAESWAVTATHDFLATDLTVHDGMVLIAADDDDTAATDFFHLMWFDVSSQPPTEQRVETISTADGSELEAQGIAIHDGTIVVTGHERVGGNLGEEYLWDVDLTTNEAVNKRAVLPVTMDVPGVDDDEDTGSQSMASDGTSLVAVAYPSSETWLWRYDADGSVLSVHVPDVPAFQCLVWASP